MKNNRILNLCLILFLLLAMGVFPASAGQARAAVPAEGDTGGADQSLILMNGQIRLPANALNYYKGSTVITQYNTGLRWQADYADWAFWETPRPVDWDGVSNVELRLYFYPMTATAGNVDFFIRPRAYNPGDVYADAAGLNGTPVAVGLTNQVRMQSFTIPAATFGAKALWLITLQRGGAGETYLNDVVLMAVELRYARQVVAASQIGLPANALNYSKASTIITQYTLGLRWQSNFSDWAFWEAPRPVDWDGTGNVELRLYFYPMTGTAGNASFFIRPRAYDPGDVYADVATLSSTAVAVGLSGQIRMQSFTIPAARFGSKAMWMITLQRDSTSETYADDVVLMAVELRYPRQAASSSQSGLPANALNFDKTSAVVTQSTLGLRWQANYTSGAYYAASRPADWDGVSNVELRLYFYPTTSAAGNASFFIRPRAYDPGDVYADASSMSGSPVAVGLSGQVRMQSFTIPAARFGSKALWVITLQREGIYLGSPETYADDVVLMAVELRYNAYPIYLPLVIR